MHAEGKNAPFAQASWLLDLQYTLNKKRHKTTRQTSYAIIFGRQPLTGQHQTADILEEDDALESERAESEVFDGDQTNGGRQNSEPQSAQTVLRVIYHNQPGGRESDSEAENADTETTNVTTKFVIRDFQDLAESNDDLQSSPSSSASWPSAPMPLRTSCEGPWALST